jgi:ComF family protein
MLTDYLCIENCRGCGTLVPRVFGRPQCACLNCWAEHRSSLPHTECCPALTSDDQTAPSVLVASGTTYSGVLKKMIYRLKYDRDKPVANDLIDLTTAAFTRLRELKPEIDKAILVPVPLHWMRLLVRGYNQAELIAEGVAKNFHLKVQSGLLSRRRSTKPQHGLGREQRRNNIVGAFRVNRWSGEHPTPIVLVDDLYTSGATISEIAASLRRHGFDNISAITAARAVLDIEVRPPK